MNRNSSSESDFEEVPEHLRVTPEESAGSIPGSSEATAAALSTHRRAESNSMDSFRRGSLKPPKKKRRTVPPATQTTSSTPQIRQVQPTTVRPIVPPGLGTAPLHQCPTYNRRHTMPQTSSARPVNPVKCFKCGYLICQCQQHQPPK